MIPCKFETDIVEACREAVRRQYEMVPLLADALNVPAEEVFHTWAFRKWAQRGKLADGSWSYFFHGLECDLKHSKDGRFLRVDFGPGGRVDTFTAWGILQFIMTTKEPWKVFPSLKERYAKGNPPYDEHSGDLARFVEDWERLEQSGCFEPADPQLVNYKQRHTFTGADGLRVIAYPEETPERERVDCSVAHRECLSKSVFSGNGTV